MVVGVFKSRLQGVVVDVSDGKLCLNLVDVHGFQLQVNHRAGGILRQRLIDFNRDFLPRRQIAFHQVVFQNLICKCFSHSI